MRSSKAETLLEALPYFQEFRGQTVVVKYGGAAMENPDLVEGVLRDIVFLEAVGINPVVVHGGGNAITAAMRQENLTAKFVDGLRVTDAASIGIIERVLVQTIGPSLVQKIKELGGHAQAVSGRAVFRARRADPYVDAAGATHDLGFVGDVTGVETAELKKLIARNLIPIVSPLGLDAAGQAYNVNADIGAAKVAGALKAHSIIFLSDVNGVRRDPRDETSLISTLTPPQILQLKADGVIAGGMIPKVDSALESLAAGVEKVHFLDGRQPHSILLELFSDARPGTQIVREKA